VHSPESVIKSIMAGATTVQFAAALLESGPAKLGEIVKGLGDWMEEHEYESLDQMRQRVLLTLRTRRKPMSLLNERLLPL